MSLTSAPDFQTGDQHLILTTPEAEDLIQNISAMRKALIQSFILFLTLPAYPQPIFDTLGGEGKSATSFGGGRILAQMFNTAAQPVTVLSVSVRLTRTGAPGEPQVEIWTDSENGPNESVGILTSSTEVTETGVYTFSSNEGVLLAADGSYWVIVRGSSKSGLVEQFRWWYLSESSIGTGDGFFVENTISNDDGATWNEPFHGWPLMMQISIGVSVSVSVSNPTRIISENGRIVLSRDSIAGWRYRVQTSVNLRDWANIGDSILGDGNELSWSIDPDPRQPFAFYRIADLLPATKSELNGKFFEARLLLGGVGEDVGAIFITFENDSGRLDFRDVGGILRDPHDYEISGAGNVLDINLSAPNSGEHFRYVFTFEKLGEGSFIGYYGSVAIPDENTADEIDGGIFYLRN